MKMNLTTYCGYRFPPEIISHSVWIVKIRGERHYLRRAVDQDGDVIDILVQRHRNARAAKRFFLKHRGSCRFMGSS